MQVKRLFTSIVVVSLYFLRSIETVIAYLVTHCVSSISVLYQCLTVTRLQAVTGLLKIPSPLPCYAVSAGKYVIAYVWKECSAFIFRVVQS